MDTIATMPEDMTHSHLVEASVGASGWTVPWAMDVDEERRCWLRPTYTLYENGPRGTARMFVEHREDGWHAWPPSDEKKWDRGGTVPPDYLPVVELHWDAGRTQEVRHGRE